MSLAPLFASLAGRSLFVVYRLAPKANGGTDKIPYHPATGKNTDAQDPANWLSAEYAAQLHAAGHLVGIVISDGCGLFCVDLDHAKVDGQWSPFSVAMCQRFPGAAVEISSSGTALHIFGSCGPIPPHRTRRNGQGLEVYTRARFIALTGNGWTGDILTDHTVALQAVIAEHFPEEVGARDADWTTGPYEGWRGGGTDEQIIQSQLNRASAHAVFGDGASFADLWTANTDALIRAFPPDGAGKVYNASAADQALANHIAWATGYDCDRALRLMMQSALYRDKWERTDYLTRTIIRAVAGKIPARPPEAPPVHTATTLEPASPAVAPPPPAQASGLDVTGLVEFVNADRAPLPPPIVPPVPMGTPAYTYANRPAPGSYVTASQQMELFHGCTYIRDIHGILLPDGDVVQQKQFNAEFGGMQFQTTVDGTKPSKEAWDAFIYSEVAHFPRADGLVFTPLQDAGATVTRDGQTFINSWRPMNIVRTPGDPAPFLNHLKLLYPYGNDAQILLCYFAAIVQHPGVKFQWTPLIQGVEGNGKTFFSFALEYCVGERYTHWPAAAHLGKQFNAAFYGKLLVCVEDVYISESRGSLWEALKPMVTGTRFEIEPKGVDSKVARDVSFNFMLNSNHKNAIRKTPNDRRLAPLFGAQQHPNDLLRCGMNEAYFNRLYDWAKAGGGYSIIAHYLATMQIPDALNPAADCIRAPETTSTKQALKVGRGSIEQELVEAAEEGKAGFREGWVSSTAFDRLLQELGKLKYLDREQRRALIESMGYMTHPGLEDGRLPVRLPDGTRPRLYITKANHPQELLTAPGEILHAFQSAQVLK